MGGGGGGAARGTARGVRYKRLEKSKRGSVGSRYSSVKQPRENRIFLSKARNSQIPSILRAWQQRGRPLGCVSAAGRGVKTSPGKPASLIIIARQACCEADVAIAIVAVLLVITRR